MASPATEAALSLTQQPSTNALNAAGHSVEARPEPSRWSDCSHFHRVAIIILQWVRQSTSPNILMCKVTDLIAENQMLVGSEPPIQCCGPWVSFFGPLMLRGTHMQAGRLRLGPAACRVLLVVQHEQPGAKHHRGRRQPNTAAPREAPVCGRPLHGRGAGHAVCHRPQVRLRPA